MSDQTTEAEAIPSTEVMVQEAPQPRVPKPPLLATGGRPLAIIPRTFDEVWRIAKIAVAAGWAPRGWKDEQATAAILHGAEVGLAPMMALQKICVINGRPSLWGDAVPAIAMATGQLEDWHEEITGEGDAMTATCTVKRRGFKTPTVRSFSVADAKTADLWDDRLFVPRNIWDKKKKQYVWTEDAPNDSPWHRYQKRMLAMRARVAFRDAFADAFSGLYIAEEMQGHEMRDVTPPQFQPVDNPLGPDPAYLNARGCDVAWLPNGRPDNDLPTTVLTPGAGAEPTPTAKDVGCSTEAAGRTAGSIPATGATDGKWGVTVHMPKHIAEMEGINDPPEAHHAPETTQSAPAPQTAPVRPARTPRGKQMSPAAAAVAAAQGRNPSGAMIVDPKPREEVVPNAVRSKQVDGNSTHDARPPGATGAGHPDEVKPPANPVRWGGEHYLVYLREWTRRAVEAEMSLQYVRDRGQAEMSLRNNLGTRLTAEQRADVSGVLRAACEALSGTTAT